MNRLLRVKWIGQVGTDSGSDNRDLSLEPTDSRAIAMLLQPQESAQYQADVVALGAGGADVGALHSAILLDAAMVVLDGPGVTGHSHPHQSRHVQIVAGPPFQIAVWGDDLEQANQPMAFQVYDGPLGIGVHPRHRAQAAPLGVDPAVGFQSRQPDSAQSPDLFQVLESAIPVVKDHALWDEPTFVGCLEQGVILCRI